MEETCPIEWDIRYTEIADRIILTQGLENPADLFHYPVGEKEVFYFIKNWIGFSQFKASLTATVDNQPVGIATLYLMPYQKIAHHALFYVFVSAKFRRQGIGHSLVKNILHLATTRFSLESVHCEVFQNSFLLPILNKFGFTTFCEQDRYVKFQDKYYSRHLMECFL